MRYVMLRAAVPLVAVTHWTALRNDTAQYGAARNVMQNMICRKWACSSILVIVGGEWLCAMRYGAAELKQRWQARQMLAKI